MKRFFLLGSLSLVAGIIAVLGACVSAEQAQSADDDYITLSAQPALPFSSTLSGNYLAGRFAQRQQDWDAAQSYMNVVANIDHGNELIEQRAFLLSLGAAQYDRAKTLAESLSTKEHSELALIYLACDALSRDDYQAAKKFTGLLPAEGFGQYTRPLLTAWAYVGEGNKDAALKLLLDSSDAEDPTYNIHAALIEELAGNAGAAAAHYKSAIENGLTLHTAVLAARFLNNHGEQDIAEAIYDNLGKMYPFNPFINALSNSPANAKPNITRAADGAGIALFDLATLLYERRAYESAQIYGNMALLLTPDFPFVSLMIGDIAAVNEQYDTAISHYKHIPRESSAHWLAQMRIAEVYEASDRLGQAIRLLSDLSLIKETRLQALVTLGDIYRRHDQFENAITAYDSVLKDVPELTKDHWAIVYARGMSLERVKNWERAEKDLLTALKFQPDNPMILNFIGYSWADQGIHLDKALHYTRKAAVMRPDDGYIVDSFGWALYRSGRFLESVEQLEKAVGLIPDDSTVLSHLGDAYWQVGRHNEARFKWKVALELSKDSAFRGVIAAKIRNGIETESSQVAHKEDRPL